MIWITRPETERDDDLRVLLAGQGYKTHHTPLLERRFLSVDLSSFVEIDGLVVTSRNGVLGALKSGVPDAWFDLPLFAVGDATGRFAKEVGFQKVLVPPEAGGAERLVAFIGQHSLDQQSELPPRFLHLRGAEVAVDFKALLEEIGLLSFEAITYQMEGVEALDDQTIDLIRSKQLDQVVLMSPRTAKVYGALMRRADLLADVAGMRHYCLSGAVAKALVLDGARSITVAAEPTVAALFECIVSQPA